MSGRAGRRGLDERGIVIVMLDERLEAHEARSIVHVCYISPFFSPPYISSFPLFRASLFHSILNSTSHSV